MISGQQVTLNPGFRAIEGDALYIRAQVDTGFPAGVSLMFLVGFGMQAPGKASIPAAPPTTPCAIPEFDWTIDLIKAGFFQPNTVQNLTTLNSSLFGFYPLLGGNIASNAVNSFTGYGTILATHGGAFNQIPTGVGPLVATVLDYRSGILRAGPVLRIVPSAAWPIP